MITARVDIVEPPEVSVLAVNGVADDDPPVQQQQPPPPAFMESPSGLVEEIDEDELEKKNALFSFMADFPWPFLVIMPILFAFLIAFGWTKDEKIEQSVEQLWIAQDGDYAQSKAYAAKYGFDKSPTTTFTAMSLSRDEDNLLTKERLEEIRSRMEATERVVVSDMSVPLIDTVSLSRTLYLTFLFLLFRLNTKETTTLGMTSVI